MIKVTFHGITVTYELNDESLQTPKITGDKDKIEFFKKRIVNKPDSKNSVFSLKNRHRSTDLIEHLESRGYFYRVEGEIIKTPDISTDIIE